MVPTIQALFSLDAHPHNARGDRCNMIGARLRRGLGAGVVSVTAGRWRTGRTLGWRKQVAGVFDSLIALVVFQANTDGLIELCMLLSAAKLAL